MRWWGQNRARGGNRLVRQDRPSVLLVSARVSAQKRERTQKIAALAVVLAAAAAVVWCAMLGTRALAGALFTGNPRFTITRLDITSTGRLKPESLGDWAQVREKMNLFAVDLRKVRQNLRAVPRIRDATVERRLPATLVMRVEERTPVALFHPPEDPTANYAVDRGGFVFPWSAGPDREARPRLTGLSGAALGTTVTNEMLTAALDVIELCGGTPMGQHLRVTEIDVGVTDGLRVRLATGHTALVPPDRVREALANWVRCITNAPQALAPDLDINLTGGRDLPAVRRER